jgi:hypothetical protein
MTVAYFLSWVSIPSWAEIYGFPAACVVGVALMLYFLFRKPN